MKKIMMATAIISSLVFVSSCKNASGDPKATLVSFFDALSKKDLVSARKLATTESKSMLDLIEMGLKEAKVKDNEEMDKYDKTRIEIGEAKIDGDKASVPVKDKKSGEMTNFSLKKESGDWKVAFDKGTMMQMGMEKMNEKGGMDSMRKGMDQLKNINIDSLKGLMEKGMKEGAKGLDQLKNINIDSLKDVMEKGMKEGSKGLDSARNRLKELHKN